MSDSVRPQRWQPTRLPHPWGFPGKNTGVGCHFLFQCMKVKSESEVAQSFLTLSNPMDCSLPGSFVHGFSRQEYWSGVPLPSPIHKYAARKLAELVNEIVKFSRCQFNTHKYITFLYTNNEKSEREIKESILFSIAKIKNIISENKST